jgi:outer membrane protein assembly factor BamA
MKRNTILALLFLTCTFLQAQESAKKGLNLGVLPAVSYNSDEGFQYGAVLNLFNYGNGTLYPKYDQSYYLELSKYTKGSTVLRFYFDSDQLLKGVRTFVDLSFISEDKLDFFGFNGYQSDYSATLDSSNRAFYKMSQKQLRFLADFRGNLPIEHLYWEASYNLVNYAIGPVDYVKLNKNTNEPVLTPGESLYEKYVGWNILSAKEADGGLVSAFKFGLLYDTRNALNNPDKGFSSEALIEVAPGFMNESPYARYSLVHKHYQSLIKDRLNLAVRLGIQGKIGKNEIPFYRRSVFMSPFATRTSPTALGGANSLRGIMRNRVIGDAFALGNFELRWKVLNFRLINQNFYLGLNGFFDTGYILDPIDWDLSNLTPMEKTNYFNLGTKDNLHSSLGGGLKVAMNQNFIISFELGKPLNESDGSQMGTYINLNYLF